MFRAIMPAALVLIAIPSDAREPAPDQKFYEVNGFKIWVDSNPLSWGNSVTCRLSRNLPNNGGTDLLISTSAFSSDQTAVSVGNYNWKLKPSYKYQFDFEFSHLGSHTAELFNPSSEVRNVILTFHRTQDLLKNLAVSEQMSIHYDKKLIIDLNLRGIEPAIDAFKTCINENFNRYYLEEKERMKKIRDGLGQEFLSAEPNPFGD